MTINDTIHLFIPGRLCLFGEHSDWSGQMRKFNAEIIPGQALVACTNEGIYARVSANDKLIIAIPPFNPISSTKNVYKNFNFWEYYWMRHWHKIGSKFTQKIYGNSFFSRVDVFHKVPLEKLKKIWNGRDVVFIVPKTGRFLYDERLFDAQK